MFRYHDNGRDPVRPPPRALGCPSDGTILRVTAMVNADTFGADQCANGVDSYSVPSSLIMGQCRTALVSSLPDSQFSHSLMPPYVKIACPLARLVLVGHHMLPWVGFYAYSSWD